jgi:hypothetical protein
LLQQELQEMQQLLLHVDPIDGGGGCAIEGGGGGATIVDGPTTFDCCDGAVRGDDDDDDGERPIKSGRIQLMRRAASLFLFLI